MKVYVFRYGYSLTLLPPFSLLRDFSFQNTFEHFAIYTSVSHTLYGKCLMLPQLN